MSKKPQEATKPRDRQGRPQDRELEREAEWRWGNTDAHQQSQRKTAQYTEEDWARQREEFTQLNALSARLMQEGKAPDSPEAMAAAELHRRSISTWFYDCSPAMHAMLAEGYEADERFRNGYEEIAPGLAAFHAASVKANAAAQGASTSMDDALATLKASMGLGAPSGGAPLGEAADPGANAATSTRQRKKEKRASKAAKRRGS